MIMVKAMMMVKAVMVTTVVKNEDDNNANDYSTDVHNNDDGSDYAVHCDNTNRSIHRIN